MRNQFPREFYIPKGAESVDCAGTDAAVFVYETAGKLCGVGFHGRAAKPDWHLQFRSNHERNKHIAGYLTGRRSRAEYMTKRVDERKAARLADPAANGYVSTASAAVMVRQQLRQRFPAVKFSVRTESYSGGSHLEISWTDGPTERQVHAVVDAYSGSRFDGMIDMQYSCDSWLLPDGSAVYAGTRGTEGSRGSVSADDSEPPQPGARRVHFMGSRPSCSREISSGFESACGAAWEALSAREQCDLMNRGDFPRWPEEKPGRRLASWMAAQQ